MASYICETDTAERRVCGRIEVPEESEGITRSPDGKWLYAMSHMGSPSPNKGCPSGLSFQVMDTATDAVVQRVALPDLPDLPIEADHESVSVQPMTESFCWCRLLGGTLSRSSMRRH